LENLQIRSCTCGRQWAEAVSKRDGLAW
jgi:hypothetical protein